VNVLYIATKNAHKVDEFRRMLKELAMDVRPLPEAVPDCPEQSISFEANAVEKAAFYADHCDGWVLADDSGLCVDALGGAPGVLSARYAGVHGDSAANNAKLLRELDGLPMSEREASFVSVLALYNKRIGTGLVVRGEVRGLIAEQPRGQGGFGYDPLFYVPELGRTYAELSAEEKNRVSHRAKAVQLLIRLWRGTCDATLPCERQPSISP
jgi:XTP/dITP diphosphohydrolase